MRGGSLFAWALVVFLLVPPSLASLGASRSVAPVGAVNVRVGVGALASPAHSGPYPIFNFDYADSPVVDPETGYLYVANQYGGRTTIYDPARSSVIGFLEGVDGTMAFDNATRELVVLQGDGMVFVHVDTGQVVATVSGLAPSGWRRPSVAVDPVDGLVFAAYNYQDNSPSGVSNTIQVVSVRRHASIASITNAWFTQAIAYNAVDGRVYVTNLVGPLLVIDPKTLSLIGAMNGLDGPNQIAVNPADGNLYIPCWNSRYVVENGSVRTVSSASVAVVDPRTLTIVDRISGFRLGEFGPSFITYSPADASFYVANQTAIVVVDASNGTFRYEITGLSLPGPLAYDPMNRHVYAAAGAGIVDIDTATQVASHIGYEYDSPYMVVYDSPRNRIYASNSAGTTVVVIDAASDRILGALAGFLSPTALAYDPAADELFVGSWLNHTVSIVDLRTNATVDTIAGVDPGSIVFDNGTGNVFVTSSVGMMIINARTNAVVGNLTGFGELWALTLDPARARLFALVDANYEAAYLLTIDTVRRTVISNVSIAGLGLLNLGYDPANSRLYAGTWNNGVAVIDPATGSLLATIQGPFSPQDVLFNPANGYVYVSDDGPYGNLWVIDPSSNTVVQSMQFADAASGMVFDRANKEVYVAVGRYGFSGGLVVTVPSVTYPPPPITASSWFWPSVGVGLVIAAFVAVVLRRRRASFRSRRTVPRLETPPAPQTLSPPDVPPVPPIRVPLTWIAMTGAIVSAIAGLFGPWFTLTRSPSAPISVVEYRGFGLSGWDATATSAGITVQSMGNYLLAPATSSVLFVVEVVRVAALLAMLTAFALALLDRRARRRAVPLLSFGILSGGLAAASTVAFAGLFPSAGVADGLLAAGTGLSGPSWGLGWGWVATLTGGLLFLVSSWIHARRSRNPAPGSSS